MNHFIQHTPRTLFSVAGNRQPLDNQMKIEYGKRRRELDRAFQAVENFIVGYSFKMELPVQFLSSVVSDLRTLKDDVVIQAHLETLQRTLLQMDSILIELTKNISGPTLLNDNK